MTVIFFIALLDLQHHHLVTISMTQLFMRSVCVFVCVTYTVGMYSPGKALVV